MRSLLLHGRYLSGSRINLLGVYKVGVSTITSGFTAGAKAYGGNIKNARGESEAPGASFQTGTSGTVAADEQ